MLRKTINLVGLLIFLLIFHAYILGQTAVEKIKNDSSDKPKTQKPGKAVEKEKGLQTEQQPIVVSQSVEENSDETDETNRDDEQQRRRIVTADDIKKRRSAIGSFLMKPFRAVAPAVMDRITTFEEDKQYLILFGPQTFPINPQFGGVSEDSGFGVGFTASTRDYLSKDFRIIGSTLVTSKNYARTNVGFEFTPQKFAKNKLTIKLIGQQLLLAQEDFYGTGANSSKDNETSFYQRQLGAKLSVDFEVNKNLKFGAFTEFTRNDITEGGGDTSFVISDRFNSQTLPGLDRNVRLLETGAFIQTQMLDEPENPHSGWSTKFSFSNVDSPGRNSFGWQNYGIDARTYIPLGNKLRVVALRFLGDFKDTKGNSAVPFFRLARLGTGETLRGYDTFRFQGNNLVHLNVEYRFKLMQGFETSGFTGVEGVFFGDFGQVYNNYDELKWRNLRATWGGGFRITTKSSVALTLLYAQSPERGGILWRFGRTF